MKKFLIGATLTATTLASAALLAQPNEQDHARHNGTSMVEHQAGEQSGHGRMQRMHEHMAQRERGANGKDHHQGRNSPMRGGHDGDNCPMHEQKKSS